MDRRCSEGRLLGLLRAVPTGAVEFAPESGFLAVLLCWRLRSIMIFLQISRSVLAMVRAGVSHRNTRHIRKIPSVITPDAPDA